MVRMTIATPERYAQMLDAARRGGYAYPAINVTSSQTLNNAGTICPDARRRPPRRLRVPRDQCDKQPDAQCGFAGARGRRIGRHHPSVGRRRRSSQTLNAALQGLADAGSDGIIQVSVGGAAYFSGQRVADRETGTLAFAAFAHEVASKYPNITVALHTDHCAKQSLGEWVEPLLDIEIHKVKNGRDPKIQ